MKTKDPIEQEVIFVTEAYHYALKNDLDIRNKKHVEKILKALRPEKSSKLDVEVLMPVLGVMEKVSKTAVAKKKSKMARS